MIEHSQLNDEAVREMAEVIYNPALAHEMAEHNFNLGTRYFSFRTLEEKLEELISLALNAAGQSK